jgi:hypothetical protein
MGQISAPAALTERRRFRHGQLVLRGLLVAVAVLGLVTGLCGGLGRLGWSMPHGTSLSALHGPLLVSGLFGTLISLERAVALGNRWT